KLLLRQVLRITQGGYTTWNDRNFDQRIGVLQKPSGNSVSGLVISYDFLFLRRNDFIFLFQSTDHPINRVLEILHIDSTLILSRGDQGCFVTNIGDLRTCKAWSLCR